MVIVILKGRNFVYKGIFLLKDHRKEMDAGVLVLLCFKVGNSEMIYYNLQKSQVATEKPELALH